MTCRSIDYSRTDSRYQLLHVVWERERVTTPSIPISVDSLTFRTQNPSKPLSPRGRSSLGGGVCTSRRSWPTGSRGKKVLLVEFGYATMQDARAERLRVNRRDAAESLHAARCFWRPKLYDWVLLDVRGYLPGEALAFYEQIRDKKPPRARCVLRRPADVSVSNVSRPIERSRK